jgi:hypothetical protein
MFTGRTSFAAISILAFALSACSKSTHLPPPSQPVASHSEPPLLPVARSVGDWMELEHLEWGEAVKVQLEKCGLTMSTRIPFQEFLVRSENCKRMAIEASRKQESGPTVLADGKHPGRPSEPDSPDPIGIRFPSDPVGSGPPSGPPSSPPLGPGNSPKTPMDTSKVKPPAVAVVAKPAPNCDLNHDGAVNQLDVELAMDQLLAGTKPCTAAADGKGACTEADILRITNASTTGTGVCFGAGTSPLAPTNFSGIVH